ncbi:uncharacterized protein LOC122044264 [Zingiber officinale]|uniref:uncharacterized protein LOC122044264 n=1 Tax=Zingiber officinale TaxID=94328 RepID=UPI001C4B5DDB|nr:uncharacterized protein LOC122044264 [Zingiber officinale]
MTVSHEESDTRRKRQDTILLSEDRLLPEMYRGVKKGDEDVWYLDNEIGNEVHMERDTMKVIDRSGKLLMLVKRTQNRLYKITLKTFKQLLGEKKLAVDVPLLPQPNKLCEVCVIAKHARSPFPCQANFRADKPLELIHADICGPISPCTLAGNKYFHLIVDDFTRWMRVFILAAKNDAFRAFKKFKLLTKTKTECKIKTLQTDRGGEFLSTEFTQFCENEGIERHLTTPYTPQQNGVAERRNRTVMAMARSLVKGTHMRARFWGEAVRHAVYLFNRLPTKALGECTPFEAWMGRKSHLTHLRVFGCIAYVKNTTPHLKKLDDKSSPMVYLGVEEGCKAHHLFDPRHGANNEEKVREFMVMDAFGTDDVIVAADIEAATEDVTTLAVAVARASSPSTPSSNTNTTSSASITNSPESYEGLVRFRSIADIYANTEEVVGINEEEGEVMMVISEEPTYYQEAATEACWYEVMEKELKSIEMNNTWNLTELPLCHKPIGLKWVFKLKKDLDGKVVKHKARLVAKDYVQRQDIDFEEVFAPVARLDTIRVILVLAANQSWEKQKTVTLSSCETEFMAATTAACHALWLRSLASELTGVEPKPVTLFVDNKSAITLMKNPFLRKCNDCNTRFDILADSTHIKSTNEDDRLLHDSKEVELIDLQMKIPNKTFEGFLLNQKEMAEELKQMGLQMLRSRTSTDQFAKDVIEEDVTPEDRLTSLHDDLLISNLSFLPIKQRVALSVVCARFRRRLLPSVPRLDAFRLDVNIHKDLTFPGALIRQCHLVFHDVADLAEPLEQLLADGLDEADVQDLTLEISGKGWLYLSGRENCSFLDIKSLRSLFLNRIFIVSRYSDRRPLLPLGCAFLTFLKMKFSALSSRHCISSVAMCSSTGTA